jgi:hypothetical protein
VNGPGPAGGAGVSVIGGYLGSGKTTLVNHLLQHSGGMRLAVLVNDFGAIAIDASLVVSRSTSVISLSGGCVCCSFGSDLIGALQSLATGVEAPHAILIETSGVALPRIVLQSASLVPGMTARSVTTVIDARPCSRAADRFRGYRGSQVATPMWSSQQGRSCIRCCAARRRLDSAINPSASCPYGTCGNWSEAIVRSAAARSGARHPWLRRAAGCPAP